MGKIVISTNVSLDGVVQDPDGEEGFGRGGWFVQYGGRDLEEWGKAEYAGLLDGARLERLRKTRLWGTLRRPSRRCTRSPMSSHC